MLDADGSYPAKPDGGDVRFALNADGTNQLAADVIEFTTDNDPANGTALIHVKFPSIVDSSDNDIYVFYNSASASMLSPSDTYGQYNAYPSDCIAWHSFNEDPSGSNPTQTNRTSVTTQDIDTTNMESGDLVSGDFAQALDFDGTNESGLYENSYNVGNNSFWVESYMNPDAVGSYQIIAAKDFDASNRFFALGHSESATKGYFTIFSASAIQGGGVSASVWEYLAGGREDGVGLRLYEGISKFTSVVYAKNDNFNKKISVAWREFSGFPQYFNGKIQELVFWDDIILPDGYFATRRSNLKGNYSTWVTVGTPESVDVYVPQLIIWQ
jgi:hypothetical protein